MNDSPVLIAILIVVLPCSTIFVTGALTVMTQHIHLLGIEAILDQEFKIVAAVTKVEVSTQMLVHYILERDLAEAAAVSSVLHHPEVLQFAITGVVPDEVSLDIELPA